LRFSPAVPSALSAAAPAAAIVASCMASNGLSGIADENSIDQGPAAKGNFAVGLLYDKCPLKVFFASLPLAENRKFRRPF